VNNVSRYPWPWIVAALGIATIIYALGLLYAGERIAGVRREALANQQLRLNQDTLRLEDAAGVAVQLAHVATVAVRGEHSRTDLERDVHRLLAASDRSLIYGIGVFYAPFAYDHAAMRFGIYRFTVGPKRDMLQWVLPGSAYDYLGRPWYMAAVRAHGKPALTGPYLSPHGLSFVGASEEFDVDGKIGGVVLVEALQSALAQMLAVASSSEERLWVTDAHGSVIAGVAPAPGFQIDSKMFTRLRSAPWTVHLASYFPTVVAARQDAFAIGLPVTIVYWAIVAFAVLALVRFRRLQLRALALQETASRDPLTGLRNRSYLMARLDDQLRAPERERQTAFTVLFVDLDRFAVVNDSLGHAVGDQLLCAIAERMSSIVPDGAVLGRIGGDEFVAYLPLAAQAGAELAADRIIRALSKPFEVEERDIYISASIGIVTSTPRYASAIEMLRDADTAMYAAKNSGRSRFAVFDERMRERAIARHSMETALRRAVENRRVFAKYQPIVDLRTGRVASMEALARWIDDNGASVSPSIFIPLAEQSGTVDAIDSQVLQQACRDAVRLQARLPGLSVSVNASATRLHRGDIVAKTKATLEDSGLDPKLLKIELTETAIMERADEALTVLEQLRALGPQVVIDDFGTGHSSLSYAQKLPVAGMKIDRSFIEPMMHDRQSLAIVRAIVALAKTLGLYVVAEGVEREEQVEKLRSIGVDYGQGFYFSPAIDAPEMAAFIEGSQTRYAAPHESVASAS
jgi:Amt family ammonium transporter